MYTGTSFPKKEKSAGKIIALRYSAGIPCLKM